MQTLKGYTEGRRNFYSYFVLQSQVDFRLLNGLLPFFPIPSNFSPLLNPSLVNIWPKTLPPSVSWSSSYPYTPRLSAENLLDCSGTIHPTDLTSPILPSHSCDADNVHVFTYSGSNS